MPLTPLLCPACKAAVPLTRPAGKPVVCPNCGRVQATPAAASEAGGWFYARGRKRQGPVTLPELWRLASAGLLRPDDMVLQAGSGRWVAAGSVPGLFPAPPALPTAVRPAAPAEDSGAPRVTGDRGALVNGLVAGPGKRPWSPTLVFILGILFGLPWLGVALAVNHRRLGLTGPGWWPLGIAAASLVLMLLSFWVDALALSLLLVLVAVMFFVLLWCRDALPQRRAFTAWAAAGFPRASWVPLVLTGVAWSVLYVVLDSLARPLSAREVAERFARACQRGDTDALRRYSDERMHFAIAALPRQEGDGRHGYFKLLGERRGPDGPASDKFYAVGFGRGFRLNGVNSDNHPSPAATITLPR